MHLLRPRAFASVLTLSALLATPVFATAQTSASLGSRSVETQTLETKPATAQPRLVGYFPQWGLYNQPQYTAKNLVPASTAQSPMLDQINYAQAFVTDRHCSVADPNADLNYTFSAAQSVSGIADDPAKPFRGNLHQLQLLKQRFPNLRILISLEGRSASFAEDALPENREDFVRSCVDLFLKGNLTSAISAPKLFDGIDVDWEYPHQPDAENFKALLLEFRRQMDAVRPGLTLSIAVGPSPRMYEGTDMAGIGTLVDQVGLMTYDFNGPWSETTGFIAPLTAAPDYDGGTVDHSVKSYRNAGVASAKLLMGVPFYGYGWRLVPEESRGLLQEGQAIRGDRPYSYIETLAAQSTLYRDPESQTPWLFDGDAFWTYDDPLSIRHKAAYAVDHQLGGLMIWELGQDNATATLLRAAHEGLHRSASDQPVAASSTLDSSSPTATSISR